MPLFGVNMAVPMKDNNRESQIYILTNSENVLPPENISRKYIFFKSFQLLISLFSLSLFVYGAQAGTRNKAEDLVICAALGAFVFYPVLFIALSINIKERPIYLMVINIGAILILFAVGGGTISNWLNTNRLNYTQDTINATNTESVPMILTSSFMCIISGFLYMLETLVMSFDVRSVVFGEPHS